MPIKVDNVSYIYFKKTPDAYLALDSVSLKIADNSFTFIVGHTGSGKSTLVQMFNGLSIPSSGTLTVNDFCIDSKNKKIKNVKDLRKEVGLVFQFPEYQLFEETIEKDVAFGLKNYGVKEKDAIKEAHKILNLLGFDESYYQRSPFDLSGGERRKIALGGILILNPKIIVLDEPTAGLDPKNAQEVMELIADLHKQGKTIIMISHDMELVYKYSTHVIVLNDGKVAFDGDKKDLFKQDTSRLSIELPKIYEFIYILNKNGFNVDENIESIDELVSFLKGKRNDE